MRFPPADEGRHDAHPGVESWGFEYGGGGATGRIRLSLDTGHGLAAFVADLVLPGLGRLVVADESVPVPRPAAGLDVRTDGLWASLYCETPYEHWTLGLEAFGLRIDGEGVGDGEGDVAAWADLVGERLPVGFDLEWELRGPPEPLADGAGYTQPGVVFGEVLVGRDRVAVDAPAVRDHWWGGAPGIRSEVVPGLDD